MFNLNDKLNKYLQLYPKVNTKNSLLLRKERYQIDFKDIYQHFCIQISEENLINEDSFSILQTYTKWIDDWILFTWRLVFEELDLIQHNFLLELDQKTKYLKKNITQKKQALKNLHCLLQDASESTIKTEKKEQTYYLNRCSILHKEVDQLQKEVVDIQEMVVQINEGLASSKNVQSSFVIFARGGYGRSEVTFSSDVDLGICVNSKEISKGFYQIVRECIKRFEEYLQETSLEIANQYFELSENVERFTNEENIHTFFSLLESRFILGEKNILTQFQSNLQPMIPHEKIIRYLRNQISVLKSSPNNEFYIKEGIGGIRHLQYVIWIILILSKNISFKTKDLLCEAHQKKWIRQQEMEDIYMALEFYFDLRNFLGLSGYYETKLVSMGVNFIEKKHVLKKDYWNDTASLLYLKLKKRFLTIDFLDRFRLHSVYSITKITEKILHRILNQTIKEQVGDIVISKHLDSFKIIEIELHHNSPNSDSSLFPLFKKNHLFSLFLYIAKTGNQLSSEWIGKYSEKLEDHLSFKETCFKEEIKHFILQLFISDYASIAIRQMLEISSIINRSGGIQSLLGIFLPEIDKMRFLLRNITIHEYPLCVHSINALEQMEKEIVKIRKQEPELWAYLDKNDLFSLKWSILFHDVGKVDPLQNHETHGPERSEKMLLSLGWNIEEPTLDMIQFLILHHQSVVRFHLLSNYMDTAIVHFFELANRDPKKILMLYLVNLTDYISVSEEMKKKSGHFKNFFQECLHILYQYKTQNIQISMRDIVNEYLDNKKNELIDRVTFETLLQKCKLEGIKTALIKPLKELKQTDILELVNEKSPKLKKCLSYLNLGGMDEHTIERYSEEFISILKPIIHKKNLEKLTSTILPIQWFFTVFPNHYLINQSPVRLYYQLCQFEKFQEKNIILFYSKGHKKNFDTVLFYSKGDPLFYQKISYLSARLNWHIESGKMNQVQYENNTIGFVGYLFITQIQKQSVLDKKSLEDMFYSINPSYISLIRSWMEYFPSLYVQYLLEENRNDYIYEKNELFIRERGKFVGLKMSMNNVPFCLFKIFKTLHKFKVVPNQVTITTTGEKVVDYFYISAKDIQKLQKTDFENSLHSNLNSNLTIQNFDTNKK